MSFHPRVLKASRFLDILSLKLCDQPSLNCIFALEFTNHQQFLALFLVFCQVLSLIGRYELNWTEEMSWSQGLPQVVNDLKNWFNSFADQVKHLVYWLFCPQSQLIRLSEISRQVNFHHQSIIYGLNLRRTSNFTLKVILNRPFVSLFLHSQKFLILHT